MKVKYVPCQPHCFAFGGFDMQMINTLDAVVNEGVDASRMDNWSRDQDFEIIHFWGVGALNFQTIYWAKKAGKGLVATVLIPYHDTLRSKMGYLYRRFFTGTGKQLVHDLSLLDAIVVVNRQQKRILSRYYHVPAAKVEIIPHLVEDKYFEIPHFNFSEKYQVKDYVLCTGNISPRKNQVNLALACINLNLNLVLIGNILDGESAYGGQLEALCTANKNIVWVKELPKASEELVAAYYHCSIYALPSKNETQPISALEAVAMKKPLLLLDREYAHQEYYKGAFLCKSPSVKGIQYALTQALDIRVPPGENYEILHCKANSVGERYKLCYQKLVE